MKHEISMDLDRVREAYVKKSGKNPNMRILAKEFGVTHTALYNWKKGMDLGKIEAVLTIMKKTGLSFNQIFKIKRK